MTILLFAAAYFLVFAFQIKAMAGFDFFAKREHSFSTGRGQALGDAVGTVARVDGFVFGQAGG